MRQNCTTSKFSPSKFFQKTLQILNDKTFFDLSINFKKPRKKQTCKIILKVEIENKKLQIFY